MELFYYFCKYLGIVLILTYLWTHRKAVGISIATFPRDFRLITHLALWGLFDWVWRRIRNETIFKSLDKHARNSPRRVCFYFQDEEWTYGQVQKMSFKVANYFHEQGYRKGDVVGLAMGNRPECICIWLGLSRLGVTTALINYNLRGDSLKHCVTVANCKAVIFGCELREAFEDIWRETPPPPGVAVYELDRYLDDLSQPTSESKGSLKINDLRTCLKTASGSGELLRTWIQRHPEEDAKFIEPFLYIYTSGTTGLPKTARCSHARLIVGCTTYKILGLTEEDIFYCPLPLYHTVALTVVVWALAYGVPMVIVQKFSASRFWRDVNNYKVTTCMYLGELCRFIVNQPPQPELERSHNVRLILGFGSKPEVWETFVKRFKVKRFVEAYGSSEGNCTMINAEGTKVGAIGYFPIWTKLFYSVTVIKVDEITGEIIRDPKTGLAIACKANESGELIGKISKIIPSLRFDGYTNKEATEKKIGRNLFRKGDAYFRTGDIVSQDEYGYFYFKDRIGDTFRWKGENVSTTEVEGVILKACDMRTTLVYGVTVPGAEGRVGMAAIVDTDGSLDWERLGHVVGKELPSYAIPMFVRIIRESGDVDMTGTFKLQKFKLQMEGFDLETVKDTIFIYNGNDKSYKRLEMETFQEIMKGSYRL